MRQDFFFFCTDKTVTSRTLLEENDKPLLDLTLLDLKIGENFTKLIDSGPNVTIIIEWSLNGLLWRQIQP